MGSTKTDGRPDLAPGLSFADPVISHAPERKITFVILILSFTSQFPKLLVFVKNQQKPTSLFQGHLAFLLKLAAFEAHSRVSLLFIPIESAVPSSALDSVLISVDSTFHLYNVPSF